MVVPRPDVAAPLPAPVSASGPSSASGRAEPRSRRRLDLRTLLAVVAVALAASPIVFDVVRITAGLDRTYLPWGDDALLELNARDALRGRQLTGPYSRFGWHHPGPAEAFVLALPVRLAGDGAGLPLGSALWNLGMAAALLALVWRRHGPTAAIGASLAVLVVLAGAPPDVVHQPWNPLMVLLPMLLLLVLVGDVVGSSGLLARVARDVAPARAWAEAGLPSLAWAETGLPSLAWAAVIGTFCVQSHLSTAPTVSVLLGLGSLSLLVAGRRARRVGGLAPGWWRRPGTLTGLGLAVLLWVPPLWEALTRNPGNPGLVAKFFAEGNPGTPAKEAVKASILAMSAFPFGFPPSALTPGRSRETLIGGFAILVVLGLTTLGVALGRRSSAAVALVAVVGVATVVAQAANTRITGGVHDYLVVWQESMPGALIVAMGVALGRPRWKSARTPADWRRPGGRRVLAVRPRARMAVALAGFVLVAVVAVHDLRYLRRNTGSPVRSNPGVEAALAALRPVLRSDDSRVLFTIQDCDAWPAAAGVAVALERQGRETAVDGAVCSWGDFTVYFGDHRRRRGDESLEVEWARADRPGQVLNTAPLPGTFINAVAGWRRLR